MIDFRDIKNNQRKYIKNKSELTIALKQSIDTFEIKSNKIDIDSHEKKTLWFNKFPIISDYLKYKFENIMKE